MYYFLYLMHNIAHFSNNSEIFAFAVFKGGNGDFTVCIGEACYGSCLNIIKHIAVIVDNTGTVVCMKVTGMC